MGSSNKERSPSKERKPPPDKQDFGPQGPGGGPPPQPGQGKPGLGFWPGAGQDQGPPPWNPNDPLHLDDLPDPHKPLTREWLERFIFLKNNYKEWAKMDNDTGLLSIYLSFHTSRFVSEFF